VVLSVVLKEPMMTNQDIHSVVEDEGTALAGALAPSSRSGARRREPVILVFPAHTAASEAGGEAIEHEAESFSSLGSIAVRLIAEWTLPRMKMKPLERGEDQAPAATDTLNVGEDRSGSDW
jgi:hypothetical protein